MVFIFPYSKWTQVKMAQDYLTKTNLVSDGKIIIHLAFNIYKQ